MKPMLVEERRVPEQPSVSPLYAAVLARCPRCGQGRLFKDVLEMRQACDSCGLDYRFMISRGWFSSQLLKHNSYYGFDTPMIYLDLYIPYVFQGMNIRIGRIISEPDIEAQLAPNNLMASHSILYGFDPYCQEGIFTTTKINNQWTIQAGISCGTDVAIWLVTFALTVLADLTVAVQVGMVLAALLYIRRVAATTSVEVLTNEALAQARIHTLHDREIPPDVSIVVIRGPFLFGATEQLRPIVDRIDRLPPIVIFRLRFMSAIDATGVHALEDVALRLRASGRTAIFCGARDQPAAALARAGFADVVGAANVCPHIQAALDRARQQRAA